MTGPQSSTKSETRNPLLAEWTGTFALPPFGSIGPEYFRPAFDRALSQHRTEIDAIAEIGRASCRERVLAMV
jgi:peptidyl-dipeptidase Dcp